MRKQHSGAISQSTSIAYAASVLPHFRSIINNGVAQACAKDGFLRRSLTAYKGYSTHEETSAIQGRPWVRPEDILEIVDQKLDLAPSATKSHSDNFIKLEKWIFQIKDTGRTLFVKRMGIRMKSALPFEGRIEALPYGK